MKRAEILFLILIVCPLISSLTEVNFSGKIYDEKKLDNKIFLILTNKTYNTSIDNYGNFYFKDIQINNSLNGILVYKNQSKEINLFNISYIEIFIEKNEEIRNLNFYIFAGIFLIIIILYFILRNPREDFARLDIIPTVEKEGFILEEDNKISDAIELFSQNNLSLIPVLNSKKVVGIIDKKDIIRECIKRDFKNFEKIKIKKIVNKKYSSMQFSINKGDLYELIIRSKSSGVIIERKGDFKESVDLFNVLDRLRKYQINFENPPTMSEAANNEVMKISFSENVKEICLKLFKNNSMYGIVYKEEQFIGIVTYKDILNVLKNNLDFEKTIAIQIMSPNLVTMNPGESLIEGAKIMTEKKFNQIPIVFEGKIIGIVNIKNLVKRYFEVISELKKIN